MKYEVVVVGGGIGGLTTAALLAARGVNVCLLERQSYIGGCLATVEHGRYQFEPTHGLYCGWEKDGIYDRLFSSLQTTAPKVHLQSTGYVVRLPDGIQCARTANIESFEAELRASFPECAEAAIEVYRDFARPAQRSERSRTMTIEHLSRCSARFRRFIDVQLQALVQGSSDECNYRLAAEALDPQRTFWSIEGGAQSLIDTLAASFKNSSGTLRLNSPVLRLAYSSAGTPIGIDLLSGEQVIATRAIVSNLTLWDTYGKLVGPSRTPRQVSSVLRDLRSWGTYQLFLTLNKSVASRLPSKRILALTDWQENQTYDPASAQLMFSAQSARPDSLTREDSAVVSVYTPADDWFSFHQDHAAHEEQDQAMLEQVWSRLHSALPELGDGIELIETATPQTFYEATRRRFGMIGQPIADESVDLPGHFRTTYPNLFLIGDNVSAGPGIDGIVTAALAFVESSMQ